MLSIAAFLFRLGQGPMPMSFLNARIESAINAQLTNMKVKLGDAVLELDAKTHVPQVRFRNLVLYDETGAVIASAPRAAVSIESRGLLSGKIIARSLELIGPNISGRRNLDGSVELGVGGQAANADEPQKTETKTNSNSNDV